MANVARGPEDATLEACGVADDSRRKGPHLSKGGRTREKILVAAGRLFARHGYSSVTLRDIADEVGITPAMIVRYFGSKRGLFEVVANAEHVVVTRGHVSAEERARRIIDYWQDPDLRTPAIALIRSLELDGGELFQAGMDRRVTGPLSEVIHGRDADVRLRIATSLGLGFGLFALDLLLDPDQPPLPDSEIQRFVPYLTKLLSICIDPPDAEDSDDCPGAGETHAR